MKKINFTEQEVKWIGNQANRLQQFAKKALSSDDKNKAQLNLIKQLVERFHDDKDLEKMLPRKLIRVLQELCVKCIINLDNVTIPGYNDRLNNEKDISQRIKIKEYITKAEETKQYIGDLLVKVEASL